MEAVQAWGQLRGQLIPLATAGDLNAFNDLGYNKVTPAGDAAFIQLDAVQDAEAGAAAALVKQSDADFASGLKLFVLLAVTGLSVTTVLTWLITRGITGPLARVLHVVQGMAQGRLDQRVEHECGDEIGQLAAALDTSTTDLARVIRQIKHQRNRPGRLLARADRRRRTAVLRGAGVRITVTGRLRRDRGDQREYRDRRRCRGADDLSDR